MPGQKRKRSQSPVQVASADEIDISSALTGQTSRNNLVEDDDDGDLHDMIQNSISKRDVKGGMEVLKKVKRRTKLVKGEVGGGSFQSMGMDIIFPPAKRINHKFPVQVFTLRYCDL